LAAPIGVFDSGHGGLTVLAALERRLPQEHFLYLGDHAAAPYGQRQPAEIYRRTEAAVELLFALGCRLVVLACNTAAAVALRRLQQTWLARRHPGRRVLGVLVPMVEAIGGQPWSNQAPPPPPHPKPRRVALFATPRTVETQAYPEEVARRAPWVSVEQQPCAALAGAIEADAPPAELDRLVRGYAAELVDRLAGRPLDAAVLGCTHYPLVEACFAGALPGVALLSQPALVADSLAEYLARRPDYRSGAGETRFLTTGDAALVTPLATRFAGRPVVFRALPR
jgi:glutamate racemase